MICALLIIKSLVLPLAGPSAEAAVPVSPEPPTAAVPAGKATVADSSGTQDELAGAGYVPGYRAYQGLSLSPFSPRVGAAPGGITAGYAAPMPFGQWTLRYNGFLSATFQGSIGQRTSPVSGQSGTVIHVPPQTLDEYASFLGTNTMPGQWVAMNFTYGNGTVTANLSLNTWNPSAPTTYYQIGSQLFINVAYLEYTLPPLAAWQLRVRAGYFGPFYGSLGDAGLGMYTNSLVGSPRGVGEQIIAEYRLSPTLTLILEHGILGNRSGHVPALVVPTGGNGGINPAFPASWIHHAHASLRRTGETEVRMGLHYLYNWAQDDLAQQAMDNQVTREITEDYIKDGHLTVLGWDASARNSAYGALGVAASYVQGDNAFPLRGLFTFGGEGNSLTDRWWGPMSGGTGKLFVGGLNYGTSLGRMLRPSYSADAPDVSINAGFVVAYTLTQTQTLPGTGPAGAPVAPGPLPSDVDLFNHRLRYKFGVESIYTFRSWLAVALRADRVAPNSKDAEETFYVLAPRLVFRTNWVSRESFSIIYGKWFYGPHSHGEAGSTVSGDVGFDDQLIAFNVNMWW